MMLLRASLSAGALILALAAAPARGADDAPAQAPTFNRDVLPILQKHCQECHRPQGSTFSGMLAPMSLTNYEEARPWVKSIAKVVAERTMPPWFAAPEFHGKFELERGLSEPEMATIAAWSRAGAPLGRAEDAPPAKKFSSSEGWTYGEPDLVIEMPKPYWVADDVRDIQPSIPVVLTEAQLPEDRWIHWIEFRPGSAAVHHGGIYATTLGPDGKPIADPIGGGKMIGTAPGDGPDYWPVGYGKLIRKGSRLSFGMHYHKEPGPGTGLWDTSKVAIKFHTEPVKHVIRSAGISSRGWEIPPHNSNWKVGAARTFEEETAIINMMPHMHFRGREASYEAIYPDGRREMLLHVPKYDYNWQMTYTFKEPKIVPAGTRVEVTMWFNNSGENPMVMDPERPIGFGSMTEDEMNIGWLEHANVKPIEASQLALANAKAKAEEVITETTE